VNIRPQRAHTKLRKQLLSSHSVLVYLSGVLGVSADNAL
jgi:hypothetical protein